MPNTASAAKRLRQNVVRRARNRAVKSAIRSQCKKVLAAVADENSEQAEEMFRLAVKKLDQAVAKGVIHRNAAARKKSRLSARVKALKKR
jgi:small subunit ribosomal protein S20